MTKSKNAVAYAKERVSVGRDGKIRVGRDSKTGKFFVGRVSVKGSDLLQELEDMFDIREARVALAEAKKKGTTSLKDFVKELGL